MTHSYVWHDSFICVTGLTRTCELTHSFVWRDSLICVTWLIHMCDMTHSYVWHDSFICVRGLTRTCELTHWFVWRDSLICVTWLIHMCDMTQAARLLWKSVTRAGIYMFTRKRLLDIWNVTHLHVYMCDLTYSYVWHDSLICVTWLIDMCDMALAARLLS